MLFVKDEETGKLLYKRESRNPYGLTDNQMREAVTLYTAKAKASVMEQLISDYPPLGDMEDKSIIEVIQSAIDMAITEGMKMIADKNEVIQYYQDHQRDQGKPTYNVTDYNFEEGKGVSGVLLPTGDFLKCGNAEHYMIVSDLDWDTQTECVYFSSDFSGSGGVISLSPVGVHMVNDAQVTWMKENYGYFDEDQQSLRYSYIVNGEKG